MSGSEGDGELRALGQAFTMIIASEIGDKTFLIAAILAMRHDRIIVFAGAFGSLFVMSVLSAGMGRILPTLISKQWTQFAAAALFLAFGVKMAIEGRQMKDGNERIQEEMREVEEEIEEEDAIVDGTGGHANGRPIPLEELEEGEPLSPPRLTHSTLNSEHTAKLAKKAVRNTCHHFFGPVFVQAFILTFLGEWGDRSQIATIALAAAHNVTVVAFGTIVGHGCCTALAVIGGRWISNRISVKRVTLAGAVLFLVFSVIYFIEALSVPIEADAPSDIIH
ncbi:hypothetical protein BS47DRAFT_1333579 [Hydnum rufescens UP504]|uniref:GDT1 family protein n=1 Tax=Hydnum rufescens UP504 TaxID=1448309 RepID=A0A9P6AJH9_9AGAM|nr:hypothetical protein BS47DRAFT_1333579 [Hydnum rufescens UP504]